MNLAVWFQWSADFWEAGTLIALFQGADAARAVVIDSDGAFVEVYATNLRLRKGQPCES